MREDMKAVIAETFSRMIDKEDIDKITVTKLIGECHISRQTFYYHFKDIMDVLEWTFRQATEELSKRILEAEDDIVALKEFAGFIRKNKAKLERLLYTRRWVQIESMLTDSAMVYLDAMARHKMPDIEISYEDMKVMLRFYASGMTGVLLHYIGKPHMNEERLIAQMKKIITGKMFPGKER